MILTSIFGLLLLQLPDYLRTLVLLDLKIKLLYAIPYQTTAANPAPSTMLASS